MDNPNSVDYQFGKITLSNCSLRTVDPRSEFHFAMEDMEEGEHEPQDWRDISVHPSYTKVRAPLHSEFKKHVLEKMKKFEDQIQSEIQKLIDYQTTANDAVCMERHMCITTLWPPLHSRKEIENTQRTFFRVSKKERRRINYLLENVVT